MELNVENLAEALTEAVREYIADEETYTDNVQVRINTLTGEVEIADPEDELPDCDYYPVMDLVRMSVANPGSWEPDTDAIADVAAEYAVD